jgi:hypothetical protein
VGRRDAGGARCQISTADDEIGRDPLPVMLNATALPSPPLGSSEATIVPGGAEQAIVAPNINFKAVAAAIASIMTICPSIVRLQRQRQLSLSRCSVMPNMYAHAGNAESGTPIIPPPVTAIAY